MSLIPEDVAPLHDAVLVAAFEGWNDAGDAASAALEHLLHVWDAHEIAALDPEGFYDFQVNRPTVRIVEGRREIRWPGVRLHVAAATSMGRPAVLVLGHEPSTNWRGFTGQLIDAAGRLGVTTIVTLGALLADVPHTRPIPVSTTSDDATLRERHAVLSSDYEGPTGIVGVLSDAARRAGIPALSCWAVVPHYAGGPPSPKATVALLHRLEQLFEVSIPLGELVEQASAWERGVDELAEADDEVAEYVRTLESAADSAQLPDDSGDALAREFERYLRRRGDEPTD